MPDPMRHARNSSATAARRVERCKAAQDAWVSSYTASHRTLAIAFVAITAGGCVPAKDTMYVLYNFSGKTVNAVTVDDSAGGHGILETPVPDRDVIGLGSAKSIRKDHVIRIQWFGGDGLVTWYEAKLPVKVVQPHGTRLEIYLRPDQYVCASLLDAENSPRSDAATVAHVLQDRASLSCTKPVKLPELKAKMARGFERDQVAHRWKLDDQGGTSTLIHQTLRHATGSVQFRYGDALRGGPWYLNEFYSVRGLGDDAALLVKAPMRPADPGLFIVTGNADGWASRFIGRGGESEMALSETRVLIDNRFVVDTASAAVYRMAYRPGTDAWVLGQSTDGQHLATYRRTSDGGMHGMPVDAGIEVTALADGSVTQTLRLDVPSLPANERYSDFFRRWYLAHCTWSVSDTPLLKCHQE